MTLIKSPLTILGSCITTVLVTSLGLSSFANSPISSAPLVAQASGSLIGQCRAAKQATAIYKDAMATSPVVASLKMGDRVTLAENGGKAGFIAVSAPTAGYVQSVNLKLCAGGPVPMPTPTPTPTPDAKSLCRQVARTRLLLDSNGLNIRSTADSAAAVVGGVVPGAKVTLTTSPATTKDDSAGRVWVKISDPAAGWVSNGFRGGQSNLVMCP
jgi:Bacterial SH3 domain